MPPRPAARTDSHALAAMILVATLLATWLAYAPGLGGSLHFDDRENLGGLALVHDRESAINYLASGVASPIGRPLALAAFVLEAHAWPDLTEVFLRTNVLIHLLNGVLVTWFLYLLGRARRETERQASLIAVTAGGLWMLMPLLASSSLFIVQRMTTLAAAFTLLGAVGYLYARRETGRRPYAALCSMTLILAAGAALGILAKENAALLFLFILAVESVLLGRPSAIPSGLWRTWFAVVLVAPLVVLLYYLASALPYPEGVVLRREFTGFERLITQAEILWKYLFLAFLPNVQSLGPFHDDHVVRRSLFELPVILAVVAWLVTIAAAWMLRKKWPLFTFGVAWYLLGHLLESSTLSLELYYEHRNYMPMIGPVYALVASAAQLAPQWRRLAAVAGLGYAGMLGLILFSTTSLWGSPRMAAEMWYVYKPDSLRTIDFLASQLETTEPPYVVRRVLQQYVDSNPEEHSVRLKLLLVSCQLDPLSDHGRTMRLLEEKLPGARFQYSIPAGFAQLYHLSSIGQCPGIQRDAIYRLGQSLLENPRYNSGVVRHNIHAVLASMAVDSGDLGLAMGHLEQALDAAHNPDTLAWAINLLNTAGRHDISRELVAEARAIDPPAHPFRAMRWNQGIDRIEMNLAEVERARGPARSRPSQATEKAVH